MRILITGAAGLIGKQLTQYLCQIGHQIIPVDISKNPGIINADLRDELTVSRLVEFHKPQIIIHLAALKDLKFCERNKEISHATNYGITVVLTQVCSDLNIRLLFFSSDYVFGHNNNAWKEHDSPCPILQYGIDKADSENLIQERLANFAIIRTAQLYGFTGDFISLVCKTLTSQQVFTAYANLINCPTWINDLFIMLNRIIISGSQGVFHCVGPEPLSRYKFACKIASQFSLNSSCIQAVNLDFTTDIRPSIVHLNGAETYQTLNYFPGSLKDNLPICSSYSLKEI